MKYQRALRDTLTEKSYGEGGASAVERDRQLANRSRNLHNFAFRPTGMMREAFLNTITTKSMSNETPVVFVVDDDVSVRESLELLIRHAGWQPETFKSAQEFLSRSRVPVPNCLILDVHLPDLNGLDLQRLVSVDRTDMPVIFVTGYANVPMTVKAMKAGAVEFLMKPFSENVLLAAIEHALERSRAALALDSEVRTLRDHHKTLSRREQEVMVLVISGLLNKQIAFELGISEITVKVHRGQVMRKMSARSLPDLVNMAARLGIRLDNDMGCDRRESVFTAKA